MTASVSSTTTRSSRPPSRRRSTRPRPRCSRARLSSTLLSRNDALQMPAERDLILQLRGVSKRFGEKAALTNVDLDVETGEVHVVCGENGAGKSTLMSIIAGILRADEGEILIDGRPARFSDPIDAARAGIGMVHQHFKLIPSMSVAENLYLNRQPRRWGAFSDRGAMRAGAEALIRRYRFELDPDAEVFRLSVGQRQRVEILKALGFDARLLILDEPTAVLTPPEVTEL